MWSQNRKTCQQKILFIPSYYTISGFSQCSMIFHCILEIAKGCSYGSTYRGIINSCYTANINKLPITIQYFLWCLLIMAF